MEGVLPLTSGMTTIMEGAGVLIIGASAPVSMALAARRGFQASNWGSAYDVFRASFGRGILLGLEFLVAADIIRTVAVTPTLQSVAVLALIILIRTFLSASLKAEIEGSWPWQQPRSRSTAVPDPNDSARPTSDPDADHRPSSTNRPSAETSKRSN
ncbi:conserved protein of unknown function [Methylorubrum extorquens DM4]|uniref:DUF1622 domain-containing protein n=1 Tax=Methylorubrum extorquens (strain DSM 6343 / CIP 106787 / DM4) TaxID=661410 RepID=C7CFW6_METED|nr:DUF1622 domain-containing protein [Methylorubrum extorquens]CAX23042.1 conserved protein of unknown function [Methylorubrum extorquens DM4]